MVRAGANTVSIDDLDVTRFVGDIFDTDTVRAAMDGCDVVYYCVVDTRAWLRDPAPLFHTNVEGLRGVLEIAAEMSAAGSLKKFVFTSSYSTVGRKKGRVATEDDVIDPRKLTAYVRSRVQAENLVLQYARERGLPAVAMCVATTYGARRLRHDAARRADRGHGVREDAVRARQDLAGGRRRRGCGTGDDPGRRPRTRRGALPDLRTDDQQPRRGPDRRRRGRRTAAAAHVPVPVLYAMGALGSVKARLRGSDERLTPRSRSG